MPHPLEVPPPRNGARIRGLLLLPIAQAVTPGRMRGRKRSVPYQSMLLLIGAFDLVPRTGTAATWAVLSTAAAAVAWTLGETAREWLRRSPAQLQASAVSRRAYRALRGKPSYEKIAYELSANLTAAINKGDKSTAKIMSSGLVQLAQKAIDSSPTVNSRCSSS